jgi:hypothetical protein
MELISLLNKYLGEVPFIQELPEYLFSGQKTYNVSFYHVVIDHERIPKSEYEHMDKKLMRLTNLVSHLKKDIRDLEKFIADYEGIGNLEDDLRFAKGIYSRFQKAQRNYPYSLGIQVADWKSIAKSRALKQEVIATYFIDGDRKITEMTPTGFPTLPIGYGVEHIAINVNPRVGDLFYYRSYQSMPRMGSGAAHVAAYKKGKLTEVNSYQTYIS